MYIAKATNSQYFTQWFTHKLFPFIDLPVKAPGQP